MFVLFSGERKPVQHATRLGDANSSEPARQYGQGRMLLQDSCLCLLQYFQLHQLVLENQASLKTLVIEETKTAGTK